MIHRRLLALTRDTRLALAVTVLAGFLGGLLAISQAHLFSRTVNNVFLGGQGLIQVGGLMRLFLAVIIMRSLAAWLTELSAGAVARRIKANLRQRLFAHILRLGPAYTRGERTGELTAAAVDGVEALEAYFSQYLPQLINAALIPLSVLAFVFPLDPLSGLVLLLTAPLIPIFMILIGRTAESLTKRQWETLGRLSAHFLDSLQGLTTLKTFGQGKAQVKSIAAVSDKFRDVTLGVLRITFLSALALELLATLSTAVIAVEVGLRLLYFRLTFEKALFLLVIAPEFYLPLRMLGLRFHAGMAGTSAARRIFEILDLPTATTDEKPQAAGETTVTAPASIILEGVGFTYPGETVPALQNISITILGGKHTALVGPSGAGKSTLVNLLLGFHQPACGKIYTEYVHAPVIQGPPPTTQIAWVPQKPYLFHDTLAANIRLGRPEASNEELASAALAAGLGDFIASLPEGYQTIIGEGGVRLSGGQAQRLALARAFLKDAPLLILDEPSSSLDPQTEFVLEESMHRLGQGRTVLTIAHRLSTVYQADQIIVLERGRVVETGTHTGLVEHEGLYVRLLKAHTTSIGPAANAAGRPRSGGNQDKFVEKLVTSSLGGFTSSSRTANDTRTPAPSILRLIGFLCGSWGQVLLSTLLGSLTIGASISLLGTSAWLISAAALHPSIAELQVAIVGVRFFGISRGIFRYLERLVSHGVTFRLLARLRTWFYENLEPLAPARLMDYRAGDLLSRSVADVERLENFYVRAVAPPLTALLTGAGTCLFISSFHPLPGLALLGLLASLGLGLPLLIQALSRRPGRELVRQRADLHVQLVDGIQGLADLLVYGHGAERKAQLAAADQKYSGAQAVMAQINALQSGLGVLITNLGLWVLLILCIPQVQNGKIEGVMLAALALVALASFEAVQPLPLAAQTLASSTEAARRLFEIVDTEPASRETARSKVLPGPGTKVASPPLQIRNLSFTYPGSNQPALLNVSFDLPANSSVALVGPSGAGKSTLVSLLLRFWDYQQGEILLAGNSILDYAQETVRRQFAVLSQNAYFFNATIRQNLQMAQPEASQKQIEQAAQQAHIHEFIISLPKGYDTFIGEQGLRLSGGERQRLGLARALLKGSGFLILDEPTANLDTLSEHQLHKSLFEKPRSQSILLITHRLVGLEKFDQILVMKEGRIVERGSHAGLLSRDGLYRRLFELQNRILEA